jgi:6-phosphofructokinase 1
VGYKAADLVHDGKWGQMVALRGNDVVGVSLEEATAKLKIVTPEWLRFTDTFFK